jgi:hypothetical protein
MCVLRPATTAENPTNIVLIGWDGAQRSHVKECLSRGELPNLTRLAAEGAMVDIDVIRASSSSSTSPTSTTRGTDQARTPSNTMMS